MKQLSLILRGFAAMAVLTLTFGCSPSDTEVNTSTETPAAESSTDSNTTAGTETPDSNVTTGSETPDTETP